MWIAGQLDGAEAVAELPLDEFEDPEADPEADPEDVEAPEEDSLEPEDSLDEADEAEEADEAGDSAPDAAPLLAGSRLSVR